MNSRRRSWSADLVEHGLQDLAIGFGQALGKELGGNADQKMVVFGAILPGRPEPSGKAMRVHATFSVLQNSCPKGS